MAKSARKKTASRSAASARGAGRRGKATSKAAPKGKTTGTRGKSKAASASTLGSLFKPVKQSVTIRLDSDVVSWFKKQADRYQTEINSVLRKYMSKRG